ncbi:MAG: low specificity L-threonine aldolase [Clostridia bacterium]|nr:low specificity L-threonine aldolase [Clostridia bacterium]
MIRFDCDYLEGAHPAILQKLIETNMDQTIGYEVDPYCEAAAEKIRAACACPGAAVHFLVGGTQTNTTVIYSLLRPWEGVLSADTGHINCHESGAIEGTGHKVIALPGQDGKLTAEMVENAFEAWKADASWEHIVKPGMVYISHPTETGTLYTLAELTALSETCRRLRLPLYLDGARLGYGLAAEGTDITLPDVARLCDIFYIGGTKVGALFGEALVIPDPALIPDIRSLIKQRGGLLAKGRLLGIQFDVLFTDGLYFKLGKHAMDLARTLREGFAAKGYSFMCDSPTNQQFPILSYEQIERLSKDFSFDDYGPADAHHRYVRFCTSWATTEENVRKLLEAI